MYVTLGVYSGDNALSRSLFVTACPVYLSGKKHAVNFFRHKGRIQFRCVYAVVFYSVCVAHNFYVLKSIYTVVYLFLDFCGHWRRRALNVKFARVFGFRFEKNLVPFFVGKSYDFIFYTGTITRTYAVYFSVINRRKLLVL